QSIVLLQRTLCDRVIHACSARGAAPLANALSMADDDLISDVGQLESTAERWREMLYATRDELDRLVGDLLALRKEHVQVCGALRLKVTAYDTLRADFERHVKESEQLAAEWLAEGDSINNGGGAANVVHNPRKLQTLPGARRAYAHALLHNRRLKDELAKT